jgi:hypothetical protein
MPLSDDAWKKYFGKWPSEKGSEEFYNWMFHKEPTHKHFEEPKGPRGEMIYTPHDCELPDAWETPLGSIWACHGYREARMCYDQWILEGIGGAKRWVLFKRNIRA